MTNLGPRQHHQLLVGVERLEQQEDTKKYSNDDGPNHRERTEDNNETDRCQRKLSKPALDCDHHALLRVLPETHPSLC